MDYSLCIHEITKRFGTFVAVDRLSLNVRRGEVLGVLGPNGAGKTTTIRMVMGITMPDSGRLELLGASDPTKVKDRVGYLPEERGLYRKMTVEATLRYLGQLKGLSGATLSQRIDEGLERLGLQGWKTRKVEALSKGMSQKIQFLATLLHKPEFVILDEPFSGLDPLNRDLLEKLIIELRREGVTILFSTHQMETAEDLCDRIVLINKGRVLIEGSLADVKGRFATRTLILESVDDMRRAEHWPGVEQFEASGGVARLTLTERTDPQPLLSQAVSAFRLTRFELQRPNLQEIFVHLVGEDGTRDGPDAAPRSNLVRENAHA
ncbi:MAG: ATP-binding cassette domain-containing protein [Phycisphaerales bacterium]|nr:ATP-binding cassette domain-containing protein [Phycisphaerales bacterium]